MAGRHPPGPKLGIAGGIRMGLNPLRFVEELRERYGDIVQVSAGRVRHYFVFHPDHIREVLVTQAARFGRTDLEKRLLGKLLGQGLVLSEGEVWQRQRRLIQPSFKLDQLRRYADAMVDSTTRLIDRWTAPCQINSLDEMSRLSMRIVERTLFGLENEPPPHIRDAVMVAVGRTKRELSAIPTPPDWLPVPSVIRYQKARRVLDAFIMDLIDQKANTSRAGADLLAMLVSAVDETGDGKGMSARQARDEAMTLFLAGHETVAVALSWLLYALSRYPDVQSKVVSELDQVLSGRNPRFEDYQRLPYTTMVIKETMRLFPPTWIFLRQSLTDVEIGEYHIEAGSRMHVSPYVMHRIPEYFESPRQFIPERFTALDEDKISPFAYLPFGAGQRSCIGKHFSMLEQVLVLATILQKYRIVPTDREVEPQARITLTPAGGAPVRVEQRVSKIEARHHDVL